ncbi:TetR/AcrR family transcriptional regulator [Mucilaginibacter sp. RS28]|uniref:TetR/AcrR family transcriptional regulator n=1 Tax=Mucilaginibacter straminoryzae TaxID=2932774 RepID=A0A9X2BAL0_9SPHI|nr:TetR/AcrR family transcriptional regulator [Mucilaginibacter straminoryzae]MCJ8211964.1 TetR/AcrR family transcriptional regulator [Mucilaginibacter straminoryzae]
MEKEKTDKKDHILDVAERVFAEVGFDGASTRLISSEAGVNMAMLNYYFGSKEGLLLAIFARRTAVFKDLVKNIGTTENISCWDKVDRYIDAYTERVFNNNCFQKMLYQELAITRKGELTDKITEMMMGSVNEFKKIIQDGVNSGEFKTDTDVELLIATLYGSKNFILNTPHISSIMLGYEVHNQENLDNKLKPRLKAYLKKLLNLYLLK